MNSELAQTLDETASRSIPGGNYPPHNASAQTLNYTVPSQDGKLLPAIPIYCAAKYKPPTIAVVYNIKNGQKNKKGGPKKYVHEIKIKFEDKKNLYGNPIDIERLCDDLLRKEPTYLNPFYIGRDKVLNLLNKLHNVYLGKAPSPKQAPPAATAGGLDPNRKKNFLERKRFVNYEENQDADKEGENDFNLKSAPPKDMNNKN